MKVHCINNTGEALRVYENKPLSKDELGRFGATALTKYGGLTIGKEYLVMGMLFGEGCLDYLIDHGGHISAYPYPLFEVIDGKLPSSWFFRTLKNTDDNYPYQEGICGYYELVFEDNHYERLVDFDEKAISTYFRRKIEVEDELGPELR